MIKRIDDKDLVALWEKYWEDPSIELRNTISEQYFHIVDIHVSKNYSTFSVAGVDDCASVGYETVVFTVPRVKRGLSMGEIRNYLNLRVHGEIIGYLRKFSCLPRSYYIRQKNWENLQEEYRQEHHEEAPLEHLVESLVPPHLVKLFRTNPSFYTGVEVSSYSVLLGDASDDIGGGSTIHDSRKESCFSTSPDITTKSVDAEDFWESITTDMAEIDKKITYLYFREKLSYEQIAPIVGISRSGCSVHINRDILPHVREYIENHPDILENLDFFIK